MAGIAQAGNRNGGKTEEKGSVNKTLTTTADSKLAAIQRHLTELRLALTQADGLPALKRVVDKTAFLADAVKRAHLSLETVNQVQEIRLVAEVSLGKELIRLKTAGSLREGRPGNCSVVEQFFLDDCDIDRKLSARAQFLAEHEAKAQALLPKILEELAELSVLKLYADLRRQVATAALTEELSEIAATAPPTPEGVFDVMVIDPPWPMKRIQRDVEPDQPVAMPYPTMTEEELLAWDIPQTKAAANCHVFLWTTHRFLPLALQCLEEWDAKYTCTFVWHKSDAFQPLNFPKLNCEFCLYARYGNPRFLDWKDFWACFNAPSGKHSEKPELFYQLLRRVTGGRRLDLFNRRTIEGFIGWGNEANC